MPNEDRYLSKPPDHLRRRMRWFDSHRMTSLNLLIVSSIFLISGLVTAVLILSGAVESSVGWNIGIGAMTLVSGAGVAASLATSLSFTEEIPAESFNDDKQARGLYVRIKEVTKYSTAGWDDDLWQSFFTIGQLIDEKKALNSISLGRELYDEIEALVSELDEMITARESLVAERRRLGVDLTVPGTEAQRIEAGLSADMEELAMRPLLQQRLTEIGSDVERKRE